MRRAPRAWEYDWRKAGAKHCGAAGRSSAGPAPRDSEAGSQDDACWVKAERKIMSTRIGSRPGASRAASLVLTALCAVAVAGCQQTGLTATPTPNALTGQNPSDVKYYRSDEPVRLGIQRFNEGNFGLSQEYFQDAVEKTPRDVTAWIGLAASYDRLGRFDLADHAYAAAVNLDGKTASILNNEGYSYMLRGDLTKASAMLDAALKLEPNNPTTINNRKLLNSSSKLVERAPNGEPCGSVQCGH